MECNQIDFVQAVEYLSTYRRNPPKVLHPIEPRTVQTDKKQEPISLGMILKGIIPDEKTKSMLMAKTSAPGLGKISS